MNIQFKATKRDDQGTSASRRLRRAGQLPGIIYGSGEEATPITMDHNQLYHLMIKEVFHSSLINIDVEGKKETVIVRDQQWHPYKPQVLHIDFQRVDAKQKLNIKVPLNFIGGDDSPAVKLGGCIISHVMNEIDIQCLPKDLPEGITIDLSALEAGQSFHASQVVLPEGVELALQGEGDHVVATALKVRGAGSADDDSEEVAEEGGEEGENA